MNEIKTATIKPTTTAPVSRGPMSAQGASAKASSAQGQTLPSSAQSQRRTVRFELDAPGAGARTVSVVGTFNNWAPGATPLVLQGGTKWAREVPLAPGRHEYRFVVGGKWTDDPKAKAYAPNPHGGRNAVLMV